MTNIEILIAVMQIVLIFISGIIFLGLGGAIIEVIVDKYKKYKKHKGKRITVRVSSFSYRYPGQEIEVIDNSYFGSWNYTLPEESIWDYIDKDYCSIPKPKITKIGGKIL